MNLSNFILKNKKNLKKKIFFHSALTYAELYNFVNNSKFSFNLVRKDPLVGIIIEDPAEFIKIYLSVIKRRNVAVILEKTLPIEKLKHLQEKFKINQFVTDDANLINYFKNDKNFEKNNLLTNLNVAFFKKKIFKNYKASNFKDVSTVLFTSGTTGEKKGVMLTHENLIFNTESILKKLPIKKNDVVNHFLPSSYSFGLSILHTHLKKGSSFFYHNSPFLGSIINELKKYNCTVFYGVPSTFEILLEKTNFLDNNFPKLKFFAQAGGKLNKNLKIKLLNKFKNKFYVMYGATEASPRLSIINPKDLENKVESIGKPLNGIRFKLFQYKKTNNYQLGVKGKNIMKGYLSDNKLTKNSFKDKFYLTGDFAKKDKQNYYYILGRIDKTIKRFGFKINLNQIEGVIKKIEYIQKYKIILNSNEFILQVMLKEKFQKIINDIVIKKKLRTNLTSYEMPDKIIIIKKFRDHINKKN